MKGSTKNAPLLKIGLIHTTANPLRTDVQPRRSTDQRNSKKILKNKEEEPQNKNVIKTSKLIEYERQGKSNFEIRKISQTSNHSKQFKCSRPANDTRNRSASNRRIALIKEHLERINGHLIRRENAQSEHAHYEKSLGKKDGNTIARVGKPETRVAKQVFQVDFNTSREGEHVLGKHEHVLRDEKHAVHEENSCREKYVITNEGYVSRDKGQDIQSNERALLFGHVNNSTPTREGKEVSRESSDEQEPVVITRKIRKRWSKDFATNFPAEQNLEDKDAHIPGLEPKESIIASGNCEIQQLSSKCDKIARVFITGGIRKNDYFAHKAILELDPETGNCLTRGTMCTGRYNHGIAQLGNEIYLVGGNSGFFEQLRSVESYSTEHAQWAVKPSMREARDEFSLAVCSGCLYAIGGHNGIQDLRSVEKFSPRDNSWSFVSPMRNYRAGACTVAVEDR